jgi:hypothetical protein
LVSLATQELTAGETWLCNCMVNSVGSVCKNCEKVIPIILLPRIGIESIRTRFLVKRFPKTAKKAIAETKSQKAAKTCPNGFLKRFLSAFSTHKLKMGSKKIIFF